MLRLVNLMSNDPVHVARHLSMERFETYLSATKGDFEIALGLYEWNISLSGALFEAIAIFEVVIRNEIDSSLSLWAESSGQDWLDLILFDGKGQLDIAKARLRAGAGATHGKVIAELNFGFWRFLVAKRYLHKIWIPGLNSAFPNLLGH